MTFDMVDRFLEPWTAARGVHVYTEFKGEEVRFIDVVGPDGEKVQIWIDPAASDGGVGVHVWDRRRRRRDFLGPVADLANLLDAACQVAETWLNE